MDKLYITWEKYEELINKIVQDVKKDNITFDAIVTFPRGGFVVAASLAHRFNISTIYTYNEYLSKGMNLKGNDKHWLVIDDISDTGNTLMQWNKNEGYLRHSSIITLHYKPQTKVKPRYYGEEVPNNVWVVYCWETENTTGV
jgi:hypoxanthine phosphoribosyltransferase